MFYAIQLYVLFVKNKTMETLFNFSEFSDRVKTSEIRELLKYTRIKGIISFAGGLPDPSLFPIEDIERITAELLKEKSFLALQYGPTPGEPEFIEAIEKHMSAFGENVTKEQICVTSSSQQGLDLLSLLMLNGGTEVIMEKPSYLGAIQAFKRNGAVLNGIHLEKDGMNLDELESTIKRIISSKKKVSFIYTIPDYQNPSGVTMSIEKRYKLIEISNKYGIPIIEDSPYRELCFEGDVLPSLWTLSSGTCVIQLKTLSKMLFPGMRLGWVVAPKDIASKFALMKQSVDLCSPSFNQLIIAKYFREGKMTETINKAINIYKAKKELMVNTLRECMPSYVNWSEPTGGMFLWVTLPERIDAKELVPLAVQKNVIYVTGSSFFCDGKGKNTLRLNYSFPKPDEIKDGIEALSHVIKTFTMNH